MTRAMHPEYSPATPLVCSVERMIAMGLSFCARGEQCWSEDEMTRRRGDAHLPAELRPRLHELGGVRDEPGVQGMVREFPEREEEIAELTPRLRRRSFQR